MSDSQHCALVLIAVAFFFFLAVAGVSAFFDALHRAGRVIDEAKRTIQNPDPIDAHFAEIPDECTPIGDAALLIAQTESYLRSAV